MKFIILSNSDSLAKVDDEDYERVAAYKWFLDYYGYVVAEIWEKHSKRSIRIRLHRFVTNALKGSEVDHKKGNLLDNRKSQLRFVTSRQNKMNMKRRKDNTSGKKGVYWDKQSNKWKVRIKLYGKSKHLGYFTDIEAAGAAYDKAAKLLFGEYARTNED